MSGFDTTWLDLREQADGRARDSALLRVAAACASQGGRTTVTDLGCGTGALMRALRGHLPAQSRWQLVDADPALLSVARERVGADAPCVMLEADIGDIEVLPLAETGLVTASALLDLVSTEWLARLGRVLGTHAIPFYAALSYDGTMTWCEANDLDTAMVEAFNAHQRQDKGLGHALGPAAPATAERILEAQGFTVRRADSPWLLGAGDADLHRAFLGGVARAAAQAGMDAQDAAGWLRFREHAAGRSGCRIGHVDLLALPQAYAND